MRVTFRSVTVAIFAVTSRAMAGVAWASTTHTPSGPTITPEFGSPSAV